MFFTLEDPNAKIKGSRDPLGAQSLWVSFARHIISNLTTQSNSTRGFTTLLLGRYLVAYAIEEGSLEREFALDAFLRFEQISAYVRHVAHHVGGEIRGIERVTARLEEYQGVVPIQANTAGFILGAQRVNGLWGLFSVSARVSGLLPVEHIGLTPVAREFIENEYLPKLNPCMEQLLKLVAIGGLLDTRGSDAVFVALQSILSPFFTELEQNFYGAYLRDGLHAQQGHRRQQLFCRLLVDHTDLEKQTSREDVLQLYEAARSVDEVLSNHLCRIARVEAVLAIAMSLFDFLLTCHGRKLDDMEEELKTRWGQSLPYIVPATNQDLLVEVGSVWSENVRRSFDRFQLGLSIGNYGKSIRALIDWHKDVMTQRKGSVWLLFTDNGKLDVRYRGVEHLLPSRDELPNLWRNSYFINSLKSITCQLLQRA